MKKQMIAAAIAAAVAAPAAMADVKISGGVISEWWKTDGGDLSSGINADLNFSGSEDLGNGMSAFFKYNNTQDDGVDNDGTNTTVVGLKGGFGTVTLGAQEMLMESKVAAMAANDASHDLSNEVAYGATSNNNLGNTADATVTYVSPSMNGISVGLSVRGTGADDDINATDLIVQYSGNGLTVRAGMGDDDANGIDGKGIGASYTMGALKVGAVYMDHNDADETWLGAAYTMGNNTFAVSTTNSDTDANEDTIFSVKHALSKRTSAYVVYEDDGAADSNTTLVGLKHAF